MQGQIFNLHISLLPYNREASPNFFSSIENTPKGVTIHQIDEGLDTGPILAQKELFFDESKETFASSYEKLILEIQMLFKENWSSISDKNYQLYAQTQERRSILPMILSGYTSVFRSPGMTIF